MGVVVGVEEWAESEPAVRWAAHEALLRDQTLTIVHAVPRQARHPRRGSAEDDVGRDVVEAATALAQQEGVERVSLRSVAGDATEHLVGAAPDTSVVVVGHRHRGRARTFAHGSVGLRLATQATCPVVVVPAGAHLPVSGDVVVGVDVQVPGAVEVLRAALDEARLRSTRLVVVAAYSRYSGPLAHDRSVAGKGDSEVHDLVLTTLARVVGQCLDGAGPGVPVDGVVVAEDPTHALARRTRCAALGVVGSHGRGSVLGTLLGSVPHQLLQDLALPVVVVPLSRTHTAGAGAPGH